MEQGVVGTEVMDVPLFILPLVCKFVLLGIFAGYMVCSIGNPYPKSCNLRARA